MAATDAALTSSFCVDENIDLTPDERYVTYVVYGMMETRH